MKGDDVAMAASVVPADQGFAGPLNPSYVMPSSLPIKDMESLEDVRLQRSSLNPVSLPYHGMNNTFDPSFFSVNNFDDSDDTKKPPAVDAVKDTATTDLAALMLEPRSIEQMQAQPLASLMELFQSSQDSDANSKLQRNRTI